MSIDTSVAPYFDDYSENKKFYKILFRPGYSVQTRELNQLQTILQKQIERLGGTLYKNGAVVVPGGFQLDNAVEYVKVNTTATITQAELDSYVGVSVTNGTLTGKIVKAIPAEGLDPITLYVRYINGSPRYQSGNTITLSTGRQYDVTGSGLGSAILVQEGVYYINGYFVASPDDFFVLEKYTQNPTYRVGFSFVESVVIAEDDSSLLDNATGSPNFTAPGADRLKFELVVTKKTFDDVAEDTTFVQFATVETGVFTQEVRDSEFNLLGDTLARRTYDESGDYIVDEFIPDLREHLLEASNRGVYTAAEGGDDTKMVLELDPGKAYVRGYEITKSQRTRLDVRKGRDTKSVQNSVTGLNLGNYIRISGNVSLPKIDFAPIQIKTSGNSIIGSARVRYIIEEAGFFRLYIFNLTITDPTKTFSADAFSVSDAFGFFGVIEKDTQDNSIVYTPNDGISLFKLPYSTIAPGISDVSYQIVREYTATSAGSPLVVQFNSPATEPFLTDYTKYTLRNSTTGNFFTQAQLAGRFSVNGNSSVLSVNVDGLGATQGDQFTVTAAKQVLLGTQRVKLAQTASVTLEAPSYSGYSLQYSDITKLNSVIEDQSIAQDGSILVDITTRFALDNGQRDSSYEIGKLVLLSGQVVPTGRLTVDINYYSHGAGDYFTVDSYAGVDYEEIPTYKATTGASFSLADCFDFRPTFDGANYSSTKQFIPFSVLQSDINFYLPRYDVVSIDKNGLIFVTEGVSSEDPQIPIKPKDSILLFQITVPPFTFSINDVTIKKFDSRRYRMSDIAEIDRRVRVVEYYTALNLLEQEVSGLQVADAFGNNKFKNGFLVDAFRDRTRADTTNPEYTALIQTEQTLVRPSQFVKNIRFKPKTVPASLKLHDDNILTFNYTTTPATKQLQATQGFRINPYAVFFFGGDLSLNPSSDSWQEIDYISDNKIVIDRSQFFGFGGINNRFFRVSNFIRSTTNIDRLLRTGTILSSDDQIQLNDGQFVSRRGFLFNVTNVFTGRFDNPNRTILRKFELVRTTNEVQSDTVVQTANAPFIRVRDITLTAKGLRPNTQYYPFFEETLCSIISGSATTDAFGNCTLVVRIPSTPRYTVGKRTITLIDTPTNNRDSSLGFAEASYDASGTVITRQRQVLTTVRRFINTRVVRNTIDPRTAPRDIRTNRPVVNRRIDPLAQSFLVSSPGGTYVTSIDIFFQKVDAEVLPVIMQIREMENGIPTQNVVQNASVTLPHNQLVLSPDGTLPTRFTFSSPVFLEQDVEYCFVVLSNSDVHAIWGATQGQLDVVTKTAITKQPHTGVMFKSQNNSTWTEDQTSDLKFVINSAIFQKGTVQMEFEADLYTGEAGTTLDPYIQTLGEDPFSTISGSNVVTVTHPNHGFVVGDSVTFSGVGSNPTSSTINGIPIAQFNTSKLVGSVIDPSTYTITTASNANQSSEAGGFLVSATSQFSYDSFMLNVLESNQSETSTSYELNQIVLSNGAFAGYTQVPVDTETAVDQTYTTKKGANKLQARVTMFNAPDSTGTPAVNVETFGFMGTRNRINNSSVDPIASYITIPVNLTTPSRSIKLYFDCNRPIGTSLVVSSQIQSVSDTTTNVSDLPYINFTPTNGGVPAENNNTTTFNEYEYDLVSDDLFSSFNVRIDMLSTNSAMVPKIKNFRAIAFAV